MRCSTLVLCAGVIAMFSAAARGAEPPQPPSPEQFVADGRYSTYAEKAQQFLRQQTDAAVAARVAMDLLITATVMDDQPTAVKMRKLLVATFPGTIPGRYVVSQLKDGLEFATLLSDVADDSFEAPPPGFANSYVQAVRVGLARFGGSALGDGPSIVRTALIARDAGDDRLMNTCVEVLKNGGAPGADLLNVYAIVADGSTPPLARLGRLHALPARTLAVPFERYLLGKMTPADRQSPQALEAQADNALQFGRVSEALPLLEKMPAGADEARVLFWRAWAWASAGDTAAALDLLGKLEKSHPDDPWAKQGAELEPAVKGLDQSLARTVEAALAASRSLRRGTDEIEAEAVYTRDDGSVVEIYAGLVAGKRFELRLKRGGKDVLAYAWTNKDCTLFSEGDASVYHYAQPGVLPLPVLNLRRSGSGFAFGAGINLTQSPDALAAAITTLLASEFLSTREGLQDLLRSNIRRGEFPAPPISAAGGATTFGWVSPDVSAPKVTRLQFTTTPDGTLTDVKVQAFALKRLKYGPADSFPLAPPPFPVGPMLEKPQMDLSVVQKLVPAVIGLFSNAPPATQPTTTQPNAGRQ